MATVRDVARRAGVSVSTVSHVLNQTRFVSDELRERVIAAMRDASAAVESDPEFKPHILAPLEVSGIDSFDEAKMVIKARIKTVPLKQWLVGRELRRRMVGVFAERGIAPPTGRMIVTLEKNES